MSSHTVQAWERYKGGLNRYVKRLEEVRSDLESSGLCKIYVRDLSNSEDIKFENEEAYQHEMVGRGGAFRYCSL